MAQVTFNLCNNQSMSHPSSGNGVFVLFTSSNISNSVGLPSCRLVCEYKTISPEDTGQGISFGIGCVLEGLIENNWVPLAYQFEKYRNHVNGDTRIIVVQPDISDINAGIDDIVYVNDATLARISRQQGKTAATMRVRVFLKEDGWSGGLPGQGSFSSVSMSIYGDLYDAAA